MKAGTDYIGVGVGAIIINGKKEVLLLKIAETGRCNPGKWTRPGGEVEFGETMEEAVIREVKEETGITVRVVTLLDYMDEISDDSTSHWVSRCYLVEYVSGDVVNAESHKHDEIKWFSIDNLPENIAEHTSRGIKKYLEE